MPSPYHVLGIDAGGTKTTACLAAFQPGAGSINAAIDVLSTGTAGPGNCRAVGFATALRNVQLAVEQGCMQIREPPTVDSICIGMAGAGRREEQQQVAEWIRSHFPIKLQQVLADAPLVLAAACGTWTAEQLERPQGIALISGTGSMAWGCNRARDEHRCGGWGYLLGDEGSGYWIALEGLKAACRAADGRSPSTDLLPRLLEQLQVSQASDLVTKIYSTGCDRRQIASLAQVVIKLAPTDPAAAQIVDQAARELAGMVQVVAKELELPSEQYVLALGGGVLAHAPFIARSIIEHLEQAGLRPGISHVVPNPVVGSIYLAASRLVVESLPSS